MQLDLEAKPVFTNFHICIKINIIKKINKKNVAGIMAENAL